MATEIRRSNPGVSWFRQPRCCHHLWRRLPLFPQTLSILIKILGTVSFLHIFFVANDSLLPPITHDGLRLVSDYYKFKKSDICHAVSKTGSVLTIMTHMIHPLI